MLWPICFRYVLERIHIPPEGLMSVLNMLKFNELKNSLIAFSVGVLFLLAPKVLAATPCDKEEPECIEIGQWDFSISLGYGSRSNPVISSDSVPIFLLPGVTYYGERFFWDNDYIGFTLNDSATHMMNLIATISYDQVYFNRWGVGNFFIENGFSGSSIYGDFSGIGFNDIRNNDVHNNESTVEYDGGEVQITDSVRGQELSLPLSEGDYENSQPEVIDLDDLHKRDVALLAGIEYLYVSGPWSAAVQALQDVSAVHTGRQVRLSLGYDFLHKQSLWAFSAGLEWKDAETLDYYYGIEPDEVEFIENAYHVGSDISTYAKIDWEYRFNRNWSWRAVVHQRWLGSEVRNSPLVEEGSVTTVFTGGVYHF